MTIFVYESICAGALGENVPNSLQREGWAMLSAVVLDFQRLPGALVTTLLGPQCAEPLGHVCKRTCRQGEAEEFLTLAAKSDYTLVIAPEFDGLLETRSQMVLGVGGRLLGSLPQAIRRTGDKFATAAHWHALGIPHPCTEQLTIDNCQLSIPYVIKPRWGAGSQATFLIQSEEQRANLFQAAQSEWPQGDFIVQQYVSGTAASVALLLSPVQTIPLLPARQILSKDGRFRYEGGSLPLPTPLAQRATRLAQKAALGMAGLQGYVGVDLVLGNDSNGNADFAIEINPRLTTSYIGLRRLCRRNLAELILRCVQGEIIDLPTWLPGEIQFTVEQ